MRYYFDDMENQDRLKKILDEWLDTPWKHRCGLKGKGTDCIHLGIKIFEELGILKWRKDLVPEYSKDWHLHNTREILKEAIERELPGIWIKTEKDEINEIDLMDGDITLSHYGKASSHAGIYFDGYVYQALSGIGVKKIRFNMKSFKEKMKSVYRVLEAE